MEEKLAALKEGIGELSRRCPDEFKSFQRFLGSVLKDGKLDLKTKEFIALGIGLAVRCTYCIGLHVEGCYKAGATTDQIMEAATVAVVMAGGPAYTYIADLKQAIDLFKDKYEG